MKRFLMVVMALLLAFSAAGCGEKAVENGNIVETAEKDEWGITLSAENITATGLTLIITQDGGTPTGDLQFGEEYRLEQLGGEIWAAVSDVVEGDYAWNSVAYTVDKDGTTEQEIQWEWLYGELSPGTYRLTKEFMDFRGTGDYDTKDYAVVFEVK